MKNIILSFIAFFLSFGITYVGADKYLSDTKIVVNDNTTNDYLTEEDDFDEDQDSPDFDEDGDENEDTSVELDLNVDVDFITSNYKTWQKYNKNNIDLFSDFIAVDENNNEIEKEEFLNKLKEKRFIPVKLEADNVTAYKLFLLDDNDIHKKIGKSEKSSASIALDYLKKENTTLPDFDWTDLEGNSYTSENTKGKIKIIKCWFINCVICVKEFPELNDLYDRYEGSSSIQFISLAFDKPKELKEFLTKREFRFPVIGNQKKFISKNLGVKLYPTHIIVDENNKVIKMVTNVKTLIKTIDKIIKNQNSDTENFEEF